MKFTFRLQKILRLLEIEETGKKLEIHQMQQKISKKRAHQIHLRESILELLSRQAAPLYDRSWDAYRIQQIEVSREDILSLEEQIEQDNLELTDLKYQLNKVMQRRRALENLRNKRQSEFRQLERRQEQKGMEEIYRSVQRTKKEEVGE